MHIRIARCLNFRPGNIYFFRFPTPSGGKLGPKLDQTLIFPKRPVDAKIRVVQKALHHGWIYGWTSSGENFSKIRADLRELWPKNLENWAIFGPKKNKIQKKRPLAPKDSRPAYGATQLFADSEAQPSWLQHRLGEILIVTF